MPGIAGLETNTQTHSKAEPPNEEPNFRSTDLPILNISMKANHFCLSWSITLSFFFLIDTIETAV